MKIASRMLLLIVSLLAACDTPISNSAPGKADTVGTPVAVSQSTNLPSSLCFLWVEGRDSARINLTLTGSQVTGNYDWLPYEKDVRRGTIKGTLEGNGAEQAIKATWTYVQEGMSQELPFEAMVTRETLRQRAYVADTQTGGQMLSAEATYPVLFSAVECAVK